MKKFTLGLTCSLILGMVLSGCSGDTTGTNTDSATAGNGSTSSNDNRVVNVCSWGEYIDEDLISQFEKETGITVNYRTAESNEALYGLLSTGASNFDVIVPSDYMVSQLIEEGLLAEINYDNVPNYALIGDQFKDQPYDPENKYTVPYTWGTMGMIYNSSVIEEELTSWDAMFDTAYAGDVLMIRNSRDAFGIALMSLGYSVNTTEESQLREAQDLLVTAKNAGVYQAFVMDEIYNKLEGGEASLGAYYAGDYLTMLENNEDLVYALPETGANWFIDAMCVLESAENKAEAEEWMNFMASTEASLANMDYIWYASPNVEAIEQYPAYYEDLYGEALDMDLFAIMAPSEDVLKNCEGYLVMPSDIRTLYNDMWTELGI
ncbi:MAG: spermidine/putrescine ABC transporter substrate-binding protein [Eubacteriales bacterium]